MIPNALLLAFHLLAAPSDAPVLLHADFAADAAPFARVEGVARYEDSAAVAEGPLVLDSVAAFTGDVDLEVEADLGAATATIRIGSRPGIEVEVGGGSLTLRAGGAAATAKVADFTRLALAVRSTAAEVSIDGVPVAFAEAETPVGGGPLRIESAGPARFRSVTLRRSHPRASDEVSGLDADRLQRLLALPLERFRLLEPLPGRLDPVYRLAVEDDAGPPIEVRGRGVRMPDATLAPLEQALALARIRPWLRLRMLEGNGNGEKPMQGEGPWGPFVLGEPPGIVLVDGLCGIVGAEPPVLTLIDVAKDRVLDRICPGGPAIREAWSTLPKDCARVRVALHCQGRPAIEHEIEVKRP